MGLDYSYVMVIKQEDEPILINYVAQTSDLNDLPAVYGQCICINFPLDDILIDYLNFAASQYKTNDANISASETYYHDFFPTPKTGRIGCIYIDKRRSESGMLYIRFSTVTSSISRLFQHSASIKNWFLQISRSIENKATFIDLEGEGYQFVYWQGMEVSTTVTGNTMVVDPPEAVQFEITNVCVEYVQLH